MMKKDIEIPEVKDVFVAAVFETNEYNEEVWNVYVINNKSEMIEGTMVTVKGYEDLEEKEKRTATMRHAIGNIPAKSAAKIELIDPQVFKIFNEYWVTFFEGNRILDRKYIFGPHTIDQNFAQPLPVLGVTGILID